MLTALRGIRARLAVIIVLAMLALVGVLVYEAVQDRADEHRRAEENLQRLANFAARGERERFEAVESFLAVAAPARSFREVAANPADTEAFEACTRSLFVSDQLVPGTRFSLWDTSGSLLCSSRASARGEFDASDKLWFQTILQRDAFTTGEFELTPYDNLPALSFAIPIKDELGERTIAYLSGAVTGDEGSEVIEGASLPESGRLHIIDQNGTVISSTVYAPGERLEWFPAAFGSLRGYLDGIVTSGDDRIGAATRITDDDDVLVAAVVSGERDVLVAPLLDTLMEELTPVALLAIVTLIAVWLLGERWVVRPVSALVAASQRLAAGELGTRAHDRSGVTEFQRLSAAFNDMADAREQATRAKDEFLGLVSHELKTPITVTIGNAEVLRSRGDRLDAESRQAALEDIHESAIRLNTIIDNLLVLARLERGVDMESEPISLVRVAHAVAESERRLHPGRNIVAQGDGGVPLALAREAHAEAILRNLVGNALKYSPQDVAIVVESVADGVAVRVLDRGPGIDEDERDALFEPFYRSERTSLVSGMGIGLSVCARLVEASGGRIWCANREGGGCEFGFALPVVVEDELFEVAEEPALAEAATT